MGKQANNEFDPKAFLAKVGAGKTILKLAKNKHVFEQGHVADTVFYILRRHELHRRPLHRFSDRFSVTEVILLPLE